MEVFQDKRWENFRTKDGIISGQEMGTLQMGAFEGKRWEHLRTKDGSILEQKMGAFQDKR